ncbi:hypothetical protein D0Z00_000441 [Geotrichum galactomycetum]|uniref:Uncharacterized protein n=1 Tax=Geotrichum galactomycetum TaxID=27317 RepID=A0ACB6VA37_9ASCO|nr:hypothetical protein D0Z00_000441 [Geotrichum candidum]
MRPTPQYIESLFEQILDSFLGVSTNNLGPALTASAEAVGVSQEEMHIEEHHLIMFALQRKIHRFLLDCGIDDYSTLDRVKPDPQRIQRIMSGVVNFARFREEHMNDCDELVQKSEQNADAYQMLLNRQDTLKARIQEQERAQPAETGAEREKRLRSIETHNSTLESQLRQLKKMQEQITLEHGTYKSEKARLIAKLQDQSFLIVEARQASDLVRPYIVESPAMLHKVNHDMNMSLATKRAALEAIERRARQMDTTVDNLRQIENEIRKCRKMLDEVDDELTRQDDENRKLTRLQEQRDARGLDQNKLEHRAEQFTRQIALAEEREERVRAQAAQRRSSAEASMATLHDKFATLQAERRAQEPSMEENRAFIAEKELDMVELLQDLDVDKRSVSAEMKHLKAHVENYLDEIYRRVRNKDSEATVV